MIVTFIHHSSFLVELKQVYLLFDYTEGQIPLLKEDKPLLVFASHRHGDHYSPVIFELKRKYPHIRYLLSSDIRQRRLPDEILSCTDSVKHGMKAVYRIEGGRVKPAMENDKQQENATPAAPKTPSQGSGTIQVTTYRSTDEGVAFLVKTKEAAIYHAGDLNNWQWEGESKSWNDSMANAYSAQVDRMAGMHVDVAFLPLDPRQEERFYLGMDEFLKKVRADHVVPMHCWGDYSVIGRIKGMECSKAYRDAIVDIRRDGETFEFG